MTLAARAYIALVIAVGALALGHGFLLWNPQDLPRFLCYLALAALASGLKVRLPGVTGTMSVLFLFLLAGIVELGLPETLIIGATGSLIQSFWHAKVRPRAVQVVFGVANVAFAITAAHFAYHSPLLLGSFFQAPIRLALAASVFFVTNTFPVAAVITLTEGKPLRQVWSHCFFWSFPYYLVGAAIVGMVSFANRVPDWQAGLLILPVIYVIYRSYHGYLAQLQAIELAKREAEAANHAKSELVAHISHELRTPMNTILGMTYLALHTPDEGERRKHLEIVQESSRFLVQLINRLLDISKIDSNKLELENTVFDLRRMVEGVLAAFHAEGGLRGLELTSEIAPEAPRMVTGDEGRLRQVLVNILGNAVKFTERGGIRTTIRVSEEDAVSVALQFSVSDTGIGIPPDRQAAIFEPYEQADASTSRRFGGSGLGLAICSRLVKLMGGSIWVESKPREGSTFHWTARLRKAQSPAAVAETHVAPEPSLKPSTPLTSAKGVKILVAEDNLVNQLLMQKLLQRRGHTVHAVSNGHEVLDALENEPFDLVLMDVQMPKLDGLQAAAAIRRRETESGRAVAIIALTANAQEGMREECLRAGMNGYLSKPVDPVELYNAIEQCVAVASFPEDERKAVLATFPH